MALNPMFFVTGDLITYFVDKNTGLPLANGSISFFRDVARNTPKPVFQLIGAPPNYGYVPLPDAVNLSAVGTPIDALNNPVIIYYFPFDANGNLDLYYVVVKDSNGVMQKTIEAWPNITSGDNPTQNDFSIANQISNCQFTQTFLNNNGPTVYSVTSATNQVFPCGPNWSFVISGTGSVTVSQIAIHGNDKIITSPPYVLDVTLSSGITACQLRQRFNTNSGLWSSTATQTIFLSGSLIATNQLAGTVGIEMFYAESTGGTPIPILEGSFDNSNYKLLTGVSAAIPLSTNTDSGSAGFIDIYISFIANSHVRISSIQVVPTLNQAGANFIPFELNSSNREQAFMGDYYIPRLSVRPATNLLQGWDFPVNPFQFAASGNLTTTPAYICDQTIGVAGSTGNIAFTSDAVTNGLALTTAGSNDAFYLMQYLSGDDVERLLTSSLSVNIFGYVTSNSHAVTVQVYLCSAPSTASIPILPSSIGTVNSSGIFTLTAAGWTLIPRSGLPTATAIMPVITSPNQIQVGNDIGFNGWDLTTIGQTSRFAIVVTFAYLDTSTAITINSISLTQGDIPSRPAEQTASEVLNQCRFYYEKSYDMNVYAGAASNNGALVVLQNGQTGGSPSPAIVYGFPIPIQYKILKRLAITPTVYALDGTVSNVKIVAQQDNLISGTANVAITNWTLMNNGQNGGTFSPVSNDRILAQFSGALTGFTLGTAQFHYVADARLGII